MIGTKYELYDERDAYYKEDITRQVRKFATKMHSPIIYTSAAKSINIKKVFKLVIASCFDLETKVTEVTNHQNSAIVEWSPYTNTIKKEDQQSSNDK